jgi:hypothetical protein
MNVARALVLLTLLVASGGEAGHEITFYPSFYPQEITLRTVDRPGAARLLARSALQAYVGADPFAGGAVPEHVTYAVSLGSHVVLTFDRAAPRFRDASERCAAAAKVQKSLASTPELVVHPYPVTPYHDDYLVHVDRVEAAQARGERGVTPAPRIKATGRLADALTRAGIRPAAGASDATLEEIDLTPRLADRAAPPWAREGWYQAYLVHADVLGDPAARRAAEETYARRAGGGYGSPVERVNLERRLVGLLTRACDRVSVGYTLRREPLSAEYSQGVENIAYDAQAGLDAAIFVRTVKLKDFPWNGWLTVGTPGRPSAAWNPVAGFTDDAGRFVWAAIGDPALMPAPRSGAWLPNRVQPVTLETPKTALAIPADALLPDAAGALRPVPRGATAAAKIVYRVRLSKFHDGVKMTPADLLYPHVFAARWHRADPAIARASALARERLAGIKVVRVDTEIKEDMGDVQLINEVALMEVYLGSPVDARYAAAIAPPWSVVPWQLMVLMEEAVARGMAAFSEAEAARRGVPWLDLARDRKLGRQLAGLADALGRRAHVPEGLRGLVTVDQARQRWAALRRFHRQHDHFLVTSGPYQLGKWTADRVTLPVFRDLTYPLGVGSYDRHATPLRAYVVRAERRGDRLEIQADVEKVTKFERSYRIGREPYRPEPAGGTMRATAPLARWVVVGPGDAGAVGGPVGSAVGGGAVAALGSSAELDGDRVVIDLKGKLTPGAYRVLVMLTLSGNVVNPEVKIIPYRVGD